MDAPLASYSEERFGERRSFALHPDRVVLTGESLGGSKYESSVLLKTLSPIRSRVWARDSRFQTILATVIILGFGALISFVLVFPERTIGAAMTWRWWVLGALCLGILVLILNPKRVEYAGFRLESGAHAFTIRKVGRQKEQFDSFVAALERQIQHPGAPA
jgi:hypothetical protein